MDTLLWIILGLLLLLYISVAVTLKARGILPNSVRVAGPLLTVHTKRGRTLLNWLAAPKRFWRAYGNFGVGVVYVTIFGTLILFISSAVLSLENPQPSALTQPQNLLAIPGVNQFLPLSMAPPIAAGLLAGLVVHEGGHGLMCRVENIDIESMGLVFLAMIPLGAFVEPEEESCAEASRGGRARMYCAGIMNNFVLATVAILLLLGPISSAIAVTAGAPIGGAYSNSPADQAGIGGGDVITAIDGTPIENASELEAALRDNDQPRIAVTRKSGSTVTVDREVLVVQSIPSAPLPVNTTIKSVNGTEVSTVPGFHRAVENRSVASLTTASGDSIRTPIGGSAIVQPTSRFTARGIENGTNVIIVSVNGHRTVSATELRERLTEIDPGRNVSMTVYVDGKRRSIEMTAKEGPHAGLGLRINEGVSGFLITDFGVRGYPASLYLELLGGDGATEEPSLTLPQHIYILLILPLSGTIGMVPYNFSGFSADISNFYYVTSPFTFLGEGVFIIANLLFWTAWINIILGQFNCIPALPLDGGRLVRPATEAIVSRLPISRKQLMTTAITIGMTFLMYTVILLAIIMPRLLT